ncbi:hypothetical protein M404DRAFT_994551 [Pisolithus tinctorius Marx 270]|uniref:Uncharacterized protein n=1 Tax=Pisolithus tinctorius Marx 270 TaxID=870435 RepID=A0A0C3PS01_PISTI|nr:hypothetical protein M404DRAFT_994551 [Pisolithus tinctorius Marx 270]
MVRVRIWSIKESPSDTTSSLGLRHSGACDNIDRRPMLTGVFLSVHRDRRSDDGGKC